MVWMMLAMMAVVLMLMIIVAVMVSMKRVMQWRQEYLDLKHDHHKVGADGDANDGGECGDDVCRRCRGAHERDIHQSSLSP